MNAPGKSNIQDQSETAKYVDFFMNDFLSALLERADTHKKAFAVRRLNRGSQWVEIGTLDRMEELHQQKFGKPSDSEEERFNDLYPEEFLSGDKKKA